MSFLIILYFKTMLHGHFGGDYNKTHNPTPKLKDMLQLERALFDNNVAIITGVCPLNLAISHSAQAKSTSSLNP